MGYRSIKRVLGETNLERKCRLLFGVCLFTLITSTFFWVNRVAENLVVEATRNKASDHVVMLLLRSHFISFETSPNPDARVWTEQLSAEFEGRQVFTYEILKLESQSLITQLEHAKEPTSEDTEEWDILRKLKRQHLEQLLQKEQKLSGQEPIQTEGLQILPATRLFEQRRSPDRSEYHYYEPIYWSRNCTDCHSTLQETGAIAASEGVVTSGPARPFHVIKVIVPYRETQNAINNARAILLTLAIVTVFVAMILLYVVVRYVIVKPLKHLRDVSDGISSGNLHVRAEIQTNDEFQELAESFNRMLRHLTDAQVELKQVNQELDSKVDELAQLNMRLYEMNRLKDDFMANMSHELRTPLNSIIGFSEVLQGIDSLDEKQRHYAQNIRSSGRVLLEMINDILDLAKLEAGKMELKPSEFQVAVIVRAQCDLVRLLTEAKNIDLEVRVAEDHDPMFQDQAKVQQILTNLLSNAIKFTPEGGRIVVSVERETGDQLKLQVADTGVGIASEERATIFDKFRQSESVLGADGLTREVSGTGLGLSIVKELCKLLGGMVYFESEVGQGSTFSVTLPWVCSSNTATSARLQSQLRELTRPPRSSFPSTAAPLGATSPDVAPENFT